MRTIAYADVQGLAGQEMGVSDWFEVTQEKVNLFAEATGDHQWIHVDVEPRSGGLQLTNACTIEIEGEDRPACVAETLSVIYGG